MTINKLISSFLIVTTCYSSVIVKNIDGDCGSEMVKFPKFESTCAGDIVKSSKGLVSSVVKSGEPTCRYAEINKPSCSELPCTGEMSMKLDIVLNEETGACCKQCTCYGDPHCESFSGIYDSLVLCDARNFNTKKSYCPMSEAICKVQKDFYGNSCIWKPKIGKKKWNVGLQGSQCVFGGQAPHILMYKADGFSLDIEMGERAIITKAHMKINNVMYKMSADDCFAKSDPWVPSLPVTVNKKSSKLDSKDIRWNIEDTISGISVDILCVRNQVGEMFGPPRMNIESVIEPLTDISQRTGLDGFCYNDKLDKGLSFDSERTKEIQTKELCKGDSNDIKIKMGKQICNVGVNIKNINECLSKWCSVKFADEGKCVNYIENFGVQQTWCAANTLLSKNPEKCEGKCKQCVNDIDDFGVYSGMVKWKNYINSVSNKCLKISELPKKLNDCQQGINIQYEESPGKWVNYKSIPNNTVLCEGETFYSNTDEELFTKRVRLEQCSPEAKCVLDKCVPNKGFEATISYKKAPDMCVCEYEASTALMV